MSQTSHSIQIDVEEVTNSCFVVMPFDPLFETEYAKVIRPAIQEAGLECVRGDEIYTRAAVVEDIWQSLRAARIVLAELSGRNPNVMYEIGLAHALGKPTILLTREENDVPFDLGALRYLYYDVNNPTWGEDLKTQLILMIGKAIENPDQRGPLTGIVSSTNVPAAPTAPTTNKEELVHADFSGVWSSSWRSVVAQRLHEVHLVVPAHGSEVSAYMTVRYARDGVPTVVHELMRGEASAEALILNGVNYTYIERGASRRYHLDALRLTFGENADQLDGSLTLQHGEVRIRFERMPDPGGHAVNA